MWWKTRAASGGVPRSCRQWLRVGWSPLHAPFCWIDNCPCGFRKQNQLGIHPSALHPRVRHSLGQGPAGMGNELLLLRTQHWFLFCNCILRVQCRDPAWLLPGSGYGEVFGKPRLSYFPMQSLWEWKVAEILTLSHRRLHSPILFTELCKASRLYVSV